MKNHNGTWLPDGDTFFQHRGDYESRDYKHLMPHVQNRRVAVDVGAHVGYWSRRLVRDFEHVYAFEAHRDHAACLALNVFDERCTIHTVALSNTHGTVTFSPSIENSGMSRISDSGIDIPCATLDSYSIDRVDLIKIDVEGHELNVLQGAAQTIQSNRPVLFIEILNSTSADTRKGILDLMIAWNYTLKEVIEENYIFVGAK